MSLPLNELSSIATPSVFAGARALAISPIIDYEDGGIAINDASRGLIYQRWRARLYERNTASSYVLLDATEVEPFKLVELPNLSEISIAFDQQMRPTLAYVQSGVAYLRWYDSVPNAYVTTTLGANIVTPRVTMDDKRLTGSNGYQSNDVILAYVKNNNLYYRQQRDRFNTERLLKTDVKPLIKIGLNRGLRLQFMHEI